MAPDSPTPDTLEPAAPVETEAVEAPPVTVATVDRPPGPRRVGMRVAAVIGIVAVLGIGAVAYAGYSTNQDLQATRTTLATTETDLGSDRTELDETTATLATTEAELAARTTEREELDGTIEELSGQVATQTQCVRLQDEALAELIRISDLQTDNFNRTAENSAWATAEAKRGENVDVALDAFYEAYRSAFQGATGTAKSHSDRGKAAQSNIKEAEAQEVAELNLVDSKAAEILTAIDALEQHLTETETVCEGIAR
jgi:chromosome segregation ATPase